MVRSKAQEAARIKRREKCVDAIARTLIRLQNKHGAELVSEVFLNFYADIDQMRERVERHDYAVNCTKDRTISVRAMIEADKRSYTAGSLADEKVNHDAASHIARSEQGYYVNSWEDDT